MLLSIKCNYNSLTRSTNAMKVCFSELGKVKIDHNIHSLNINSSCEEVLRKVEKKDKKSLKPRQPKVGEQVNNYKLFNLKVFSYITNRYANRFTMRLI